MRAGVCVADVMRDQVVAVRERARFAEIAAAMRRFSISSLPVIDSQDRVIGLISNYDLLLGDGAAQSGRGRLLGRFRHRDRCEGAGMLATELMTSPAITVTATTPAREAARAMYRHRIHQLPVVDAVTGRLTGVITRSDLLAVYERPDEDIRGEILYGIIEHTLGMPSGRFDVRVVGGAVTISGHLERRSAALRLAEAIAHVDGVITVIDHLTYAREDTTPKLPRARL
ncbi:MAG TPA: CBS domain-containing protein [Actinoallomurus sp.]|nr:CBS domain-containing protein [Actinoallomurus sp.]